MSEIVFRRWGRCLALAIVAAMLTTGCAMANKVSGFSQAKELQEIGEPAEARVLEIWDTGWTVNDDPVVGFRLEVYPEGRPAYRAETRLRISKVHMGMIQPGAVLPVLIDPKDSNRVSLDIYDFGSKKKPTRI